MPDRSLGVSIVTADPTRPVTGPMALAGLALAACAVTRLVGFDHAGISFCYFKALTGYACFTCGTTRAFGHLSRFDVPAALAIQPLVTIGTLGLLVWGALDAALFFRSRRTVVRLEGASPRWVLGACVALAVANWVYLLAVGV